MSTAPLRGNNLLLLFVALAVASPPRCIAAERLIFIVAGQSNVLNWHAAAGQLPFSSDDAAIRFYFHEGAPPSKGLPVPFNATSGSRWTTLRPQTQEPFQAHQKEFFGPEITLARVIVRSTVTPLAVIKTAYFGTNLVKDWLPGATEGNQLYALMLSEISQALQQLREAGENPRLAGFFWMQGETDAVNAVHADSYASNLTGFIARVRSDLEVPNLPFVLGRIGPPPIKGYAWQAMVRNAQVHVATTVPGVAWVDTDDLPRDTDRIHLLAPGVMTLGERWAKAWLNLGKDNFEEPPSSFPNPPSRKSL